MIVFSGSSIQILKPWYWRRELCVIVTVYQRALGLSPVCRVLLLMADYQEQQADRAEQCH